MRSGGRLFAIVLTLGGAASAAGGAVVIDMPAPPAANRSEIESPQQTESAEKPGLGDVALRRFAQARYLPANTSLVSPAWRGWPYGRYGVGYGVHPGWGWNWGWNSGWNCGWGWGWGWGRGWNACGFPLRYGWGFRSPSIGSSRFQRPHPARRWRGAGFPGPSRWR